MFYFVSDAPSFVLTDQDLDRIIDEVVDAKAQWKLIGVKLGVPKGELDSINMDCPDAAHKLMEMLAKWLQCKNNTTWKALAEAMGSAIVSREDLKERFLENHS